MEEQVVLFISTVTDEFRTYRDALVRGLRRPGVDVQEDFVAFGDGRIGGPMLTRVLLWRGQGMLIRRVRSWLHPCEESISTGKYKRTPGENCGRE